MDEYLDPEDCDSSEQIGAESPPESDPTETRPDTSTDRASPPTAQDQHLLFDSSSQGQLAPVHWIPLAHFDFTLPAGVVRELSSATTVEANAEEQHLSWFLKYVVILESFIRRIDRRLFEAVEIRTAVLGGIGYRVGLWWWKSEPPTDQQLEAAFRATAELVIEFDSTLLACAAETPTSPIGAERSLARRLYNEMAKSGLRFAPVLQTTISHPKESLEQFALALRPPLGWYLVEHLEEEERKYLVTHVDVARGTAELVPADGVKAAAKFSNVCSIRFDLHQATDHWVFLKCTVDIQGQFGSGSQRRIVYPTAITAIDMNWESTTAVQLSEATKRLRKLKTFKPPAAGGTGEEVGDEDRGADEE